MFRCDWTWRQVSSACVYVLPALLPLMKRGETHALSLSPATNTQHLCTRSSSVSHQTRLPATVDNHCKTCDLVLSPFDFLPLRRDLSRLWGEGEGGGGRNV